MGSPGGLSEMSIGAKNTRGCVRVIMRTHIVVWGAGSIVGEYTPVRSRTQANPARANGEVLTTAEARTVCGFGPAASSCHAPTCERMMNSYHLRSPHACATPAIAAFSRNALLVNACGSRRASEARTLYRGELRGPRQPNNPARGLTRRDARHIGHAIVHVAWIIVAAAQ